MLKMSFRLGLRDMCPGPASNNGPPTPTRSRAKKTPDGTSRPHLLFMFIGYMSPLC